MEKVRALGGSVGQTASVGLPVGCRLHTAAMGTAAGTTAGSLAPKLLLLFWILPNRGGLLCCENPPEGRPFPWLWSRSMNPQKKVDLKLIIVGALGVGKTSLLHQYVHNTFYEDYQTTLGASILSKIIRVEDTTLKLQIWDTGGQERFRSVVSTFYKGSDGCILAFDVTDLESFEALDIWRGDVLAKIIPVEQPYPMVVLGNKIDLADRKVPQELAQGWCREKDIPYLEVSAKSDINVGQAFEMLASRALSRYRNILESHLTDSIKLSPHQARRRCC